MARKNKSGRSPRTGKSAKSPSGRAGPGSAMDRSATGRFWRYSLTLLLLGVVVLAWLSLLSFDPADPPSSAIYPPRSPVANRVGITGSYLAYALRYWMGVGSYAALALLTVWSIVMLVGKRISEVPWRVIGLVLLTASCSVGAFLHSPTWPGEVVEGYAGILGTATGGFLLEKLGKVGSVVILTIAFCIGLLFVADNLIKQLAQRIQSRWRSRKTSFAWSRLGRKSATTSAAAQTVARNLGVSRVAVPGIEPIRPTAKLTDRPGDAGGDRYVPSQGQAKKSPGKDPAESSPPARGKSTGLFAWGDKTPAKKSPAPAKKPRKTPAKVSQKQRDYELPSIDLLEEPVGGYNEIAEVQAAQRKLVLQQTLDDFSIEANVVGYMTGPVITLFEVSLAPGVKVAHVAGLATDIARSLAVPGVRIVPPRFGKDTVGIEVPNLDKEIVRLKELMRLQGQAERKMRLPMYLGKDAGGNAIVLDLAKCPHMLIAGTTGSGKSVCINAIITSLLMTRKPEDLRFILVDPKMVEMAAFEKLPHLLCPTVNDMKKAEDILEWATVKMDERYELLREAKVRNIEGFNKLTKAQIYERFEAQSEEERAKIITHLPAYVIIIDELADLMMTSSKEVEGLIIRIAQKARAVGIHLVLATQRPSANVVTGLIKSNMPCRVSFRVASGQESRIVLDQKGGEVLLGQGDMLVLKPGTSTLVRAQCTYVDDREIHAIVTELQNNGQQNFNPELMNLQSSSAGELSADRDELFDKAVEIVLASQRGSVSLLQRRMGVGYGRASRIIDQMGVAGILGSHKGSQARECMITLDDWESMKAAVVADRSGSNSVNGEGTSY